MATAGSPVLYASRGDTRDVSPAELFPSLRALARGDPPSVRRPRSGRRSAPTRPRRGRAFQPLGVSGNDRSSTGGAPGAELAFGRRRQPAPRKSLPALND